MQNDPGAWRALLQKLARATSKYLDAQALAGADAVQIFDSWVGCLSPAEYEKYVLPFTSQTIAGIQSKVPVIHFGTGTGPFLELIAKAGGDVIGVDHRVRLDEAWKKIGPDRAVQGNLDPKVLLGTLADIKKEVGTILKQADGRPGHIFNLGHGVLPETPLENVVALVEMVHTMSRRAVIHA